MDPITVDDLHAAAPPVRAVRRAGPRCARVGAGHAVRALPERTVRRTAAPADLGPAHRAAHRQAGRATTGGHLRRHHPGSRAVRGVPGRRRRSRAAGRRTRRGDGLRVPGRGRLRARLQLLADRRHHPRPGAGAAGTGGARTAAVLEGRHARVGRPNSVARPGEFVREIGSAATGSDPSEMALARKRLSATGWTTTPPTTWSAYLREQPAAAGMVPDEKTLVVERFRDELGDWRIVLHSPYGAGGARPVGAGDRRPDAGAVRRRRLGHARRRRHRAAAARRRIRRRAARCRRPSWCSTRRRSKPR